MSDIAHETGGLDRLQKISLGLMGGLMLLTFMLSNLQAVFWQSSQWLVGTVFPSVVVELTNDERSDLEKKPLRRSATLDAAATLKAEHMAANQYFAHYAPDGTSPWHWFDVAGYSYAHAGENLAIHFTDSDEVVEAWMNSPSHRANIVNGAYTEIGVGTAKGRFDGYNTVYVVQLFGAPAAAPARMANSPAATILAEATPVVSAKSPVLPTDEAVLAAEDPNVPLVSTTTAAPLVIVAPGTIIQETQTEEPSDKKILTESKKSKDDVVALALVPVATSSGLAVAQIVEPVVEKPSFWSILGLMTRPQSLLQVVYSFIALVVTGLLLASVVTEVNQRRYVQVAYSAALLIFMATLWYINTLLTAGATVF